MPTFQVPLCWALTVGVLVIATLPEIADVPTTVVGTGLAVVFTTVTGALPCADVSLYLWQDQSVTDE